MHGQSPMYILSASSSLQFIHLSIYSKSISWVDLAVQVQFWENRRLHSNVNEADLCNYWTLFKFYVICKCIPFFPNASFVPRLFSVYHISPVHRRPLNYVIFNFRWKRITLRGERLSCEPAVGCFLFGYPRNCSPTRYLHVCSKNGGRALYNGKFYQNSPFL